MRKTGMIMLLLLLMSGCSFSQDTQEDARNDEGEDSEDGEDQSSAEQDIVEGVEVDPDEENEIPETPEK